MYDCPECGDKMHWQSDFDQEDSEAIITLYSCSECMIDLTKTYLLMHDGTKAPHDETLF